MLNATCKDNKFGAEMREVARDFLTMNWYLNTELPDIHPLIYLPNIKSKKRFPSLENVIDVNKPK